MFSPPRDRSSHALTKGLALAALGLSAMLEPAVAQAMAQPSATTADESALAPLPYLLFSGKRSRETFAAQVMLARLHFSPGVIDGYGGGNTTRAVRAYQQFAGLEPTGLVDDALLGALRDGGQEPLFMRYTLTAADVSGPFGAMPDRMEAMVRSLTRGPYRFLRRAIVSTTARPSAIGASRRAA
jgi:hypothetical protein